jgi:hypothetical protein
MPRGQVKASAEVKASADVFVGCSSQFLKLQWKPSPREIITKGVGGPRLGGWLQTPCQRLG